VQIVKFLVIGDDGINITAAYDRALSGEPCTSEGDYEKRHASFKEMLEEIASKAFELGRARDNDS
jgi:hypothetical protein